MTSMSDKRQNILCVIRGNPGIQYREIMRRTGMANGTLSNHLRMIEKLGIVTVERFQRRTHYYPLGLSDVESTLCRYLRRNTHRRLILALMQNPEGLTFDQITKLSNRSPSTVSVSLSHLVRDNVVWRRLTNTKISYGIVDRSTVDRLVDDYHPHLLDAPALALEDIFSSL